jgi:hypothetical protein
MVSSSRTSNPGRSGSHSLAVFLATLIWCITICLMPLMIRGRESAPLPLPIPAPVFFWGIAAVTLAFAWLARYDTSRGYTVLAVSLLAVTLFFFTVL